MVSQLSRRDIDDLKPSIDKLVVKVLGNSDISVINTTVKCLLAGYDKHKTEKKLMSFIEIRKAEKLTDKLYDLIDDFTGVNKSRKRAHESDTKDVDAKKYKSSSKRDEYSSKDKTEESKSNGHNKSDEILSATKIKQMMVNAQKEIEERKRQLDTIKTTKASDSSKTTSSGKPVVPPSVVYNVHNSGLINRGDAEKARKIAQLQAQIRSKLSSGILGNTLLTAASDKPTPLILDSEGRTVDITGKAIQLTHVTPTLKANIRAKKREEFKAQFSDKNLDDYSEAKFFDDRIGAKPAVRNKRALRFHEPGKFQQLADRIRMKVRIIIKYIHMSQMGPPQLDQGILCIH